jgi:hypothetical protein
MEHFTIADSVIDGAPRFDIVATMREVEELTGRDVRRFYPLCD